MTSASVSRVTLPEGIRHAVAKETSRYAICGVEVRGDGNGAAYLSATDGRVLAVRRTEGEVSGAEPFIIPGSLLPRRKAGEVITYRDGQLSGLKSRITDDPVGGCFPPCADVVPDVAATSKGGKEKYDRCLTLSVSLLHGLARAICDGKANDTLRVSLLLPEDPCKPVAVLPAGDDDTDALGVLMPCNGRKRQGFVETYSDRRDSYRAACNGGAA